MSQNKQNRKKSKQKKKEWVVYLLYNDTQKKTYLGVSNDWERRLRQHNSEIKGGARNTKGKQGEWVAKCYITSNGTLNRSTSQKIESGIRKKKIYGLEKRIKFMEELVDDREDLEFVNFELENKESDSGNEDSDDSDFDFEASFKDSESESESEEEN